MALMNGPTLLSFVGLGPGGGPTCYAMPTRIVVVKLRVSTCRCAPVAQLALEYFRLLTWMRHYYPPSMDNPARFSLEAFSRVCDSKDGPEEVVGFPNSAGLGWGSHDQAISKCP